MLKNYKKAMNGSINVSKTYDADTKMRFGRYQREGKTFGYVYKNDYSYCEWVKEMLSYDSYCYDFLNFILNEDQKIKEEYERQEQKHIQYRDNEKDERDLEFKNAMELYEKHEKERLEEEENKKKVSDEDNILDSIINIGSCKGKTLRFVSSDDKYCDWFKREVYSFIDDYSKKHIDYSDYLKYFNYFKNKEIKEFKDLNENILIITDEAMLKQFLDNKTGIAKLRIIQDTDKFIEKYDFSFYLRFDGIKLYLDSYKDIKFLNKFNKKVPLYHKTNGHIFNTVRILEELSEEKFYRFECMKEYEEYQNLGI